MVPIVPYSSKVWEVWSLAVVCRYFEENVEGVVKCFRLGQSSYNFMGEQFLAHLDAFDFPSFLPASSHLQNCTSPTTWLNRWPHGLLARCSAWIVRGCLWNEKAVTTEFNAGFVLMSCGPDLNFWLVQKVAAPFTSTWESSMDVSSQSTKNLLVLYKGVMPTSPVVFKNLFRWWN